MIGAGIISYIIDNNLLLDTALAGFYLALFGVSYNNVFLKSFSILRKKEPPVLYSTKFSLVSTLTFSFVFLLQALEHALYLCFPKIAGFYSLETLQAFNTALFNKLTFMFCSIYIWSGVAYFVRQLVLKNNTYLKNKYCIFENIFSLFLIILAILVISSTSNFRLRLNAGAVPERIIVNSIILSIASGLAILACICKKLHKNINANFSSEIDAIVTKHDLNIRKNNLHVLRATSRNIETIQIYILMGFATMLNIYLPKVLNSTAFLWLYYIIIGVLNAYIIIQMEKTCVLAITQSKLEE